ncbi:MAG: methylenetetrahydrofolate--tRNA-(uracil(54)-C(5))-methyltransferase (FADH(2)-oxidizing) TrmFO [Planctomycetota bacterium]|nr:methylenetetrahydrofolate--tRNA-(uracil(54)-C(5))-methyltransferase (FADH(2)-oxidizing) TrmFO [Planctomycetota bacterium]
MAVVNIIGAGLAGSEAALQLAENGIKVRLYEMRPQKPTAAHESGNCAELVCSNSLGSKLADRAGGVLQAELRSLGCKLLPFAEQCAVPAGGALAVDRQQFSEVVTAAIEAEPLIELCREEVRTIPRDGFTIVASGPLTSDALADDIQRLSGNDNLSFFDAIAPVVVAESLNTEVIFAAARYANGNADYLNIPLDKEQYYAFVDELLAAEKHTLKDFEANDPKAKQFFERCLPVEIIAARGRDSLRFGPMRPVGLDDPRTGHWAYGIIQLRKENLQGSLYNLVGFQTNLTYGEQERVLRTLPGMENVEFARLGSMHRNTFLNSPQMLDATMQFRKQPGLFFAGQICGMEGYLGNIGSGLIAALNMARLIAGQELVCPPRETLLGSLCHHVSESPATSFQPMKAEFGLLTPLIPPVKKKLRKRAYADRSYAKMQEFRHNMSESNTTTPI